MKDLYNKELELGELYLFIYKNVYHISQLLGVDETNDIYHVKELGFINIYQNNEIVINTYRNSKNKLSRDIPCKRVISKYHLLKIEEFFCDKIKEKINEAIRNGT